MPFPIPEAGAPLSSSLLVFHEKKRNRRRMQRRYREVVGGQGNEETRFYGGTGVRGGGGHKKTRRPLPGHGGDRMCFAKSWEASRRRQDVWSQWLSQFLSIPTDFRPTDPFHKTTSFPTSFSPVEFSTAAINFSKIIPISNIFFSISLLPELRFLKCILIHVEKRRNFSKIKINNFS